MATLTRDVLLGRALDMLGSPALNNNDRPAGTIVATAMTIGWLQDALNLLADEFPWAQNVKSAAVSLTASAVLTLPADFILDVRDGVSIPAGTANSALRLRRLAYQKLVNLQVYRTGTGVPKRYTCMGQTQMQVWPTPDQTYAGTLRYYARPAALASNGIPTFPSDLPLVEYVRYRGLEWIGKEKPGAALLYLQSQIADLRKSDLGFEPESDTIPFDGDQFIQMGDVGYTTWMGPFSNQF